MSSPSRKRRRRTQRMLVSVTVFCFCLLLGFVAYGVVEKTKTRKVFDQKQQQRYEVKEQQKVVKPLIIPTKKQIAEKQKVQKVTAKRKLAVKKRTLSARGVFERQMRVVVTGYCACRQCCGRSSDGITCLGLRARRGTVAVDPRVIPFGARLEIPGYGSGIAADRGGKIVGRHIDVFFNSHAEARQWGRKYVTITIYE